MNLPLGFRYSALYAGIRKAKKNDLALIAADAPAAGAAVFTTNRVAAAPVVLGRAHLAVSDGQVRAVLINAGNANCATRTGERVALTTAKAAAKALRCPVEQVIPSSTGVIGMELDPKLITAALPQLVAGLSAGRFDDAAEAIMTTDLVKKTAFAEGAGFRVAGMTKGSGMIHPNMATTLGFVMTDAVVEPAALRAALKRVVETSYNRLSVDGDMSTNDTLLVMASGASGVKPPRAALEKALEQVCQSLAKQIARDGEGARKLIEIVVTGTRTNAEAARIGRAIANSPLVRSRHYPAPTPIGVVFSLRSRLRGREFDPRQVDIRLQGCVCRQGLAAAFDGRR
ncbi:MAG: bifunctional ornithine acetyltransferase/N-acetylglutamate synthase [Solibacteraceae bacterium]|nr:bifunctional ornithine acetyltransferase/N-acetylglutamate synthase [Solibacteraceae bacterium]